MFRSVFIQIFIIVIFYSAAHASDHHKTKFDSIILGRPTHLSSIPQPPRPPIDSINSKRSKNQAINSLLRIPGHVSQQNIFPCLSDEESWNLGHTSATNQEIYLNILRNLFKHLFFFTGNEERKDIEALFVAAKIRIMLQKLNEKFAVLAYRHR